MTSAVILRRRKLGRGSCNGIKAFSETGIDWVRNDKLALRGNAPINNADFTFRWGCTSNIPYDTTVVNEAKAIHYVADKRQFRMDTAEKGFAPKTWLSFDEWMDDEQNNPKKVVVRRATHHQGRYLDVCDTIPELRTACNKYGEGNYYISEYIPKVAEYRVFFVQGRVVWVARKTPANPDAVAWNVAKGGRFDNVRWDEWPLKTIRIAREAFLMSGLDFGGVDVMVDKDNNPYVLEINSAPSQTSPYRQECTAKAFDYIVRNQSKEAIPVTEERGGYRKFVHPAICPQAIMV
jgi:glutathione synthase/RimK-type ligase-like ATP-grasp enzyme